jgi:transcription antitermination factor NusG
MDLNSDLGERQPSTSGFAWYAVQVRTRYETTVADHLHRMEYELFLPLQQCRKRWSDRVKETQIPLFPGYLFCRFDTQKRLPILKTQGVIQIVGCGRQPIPVDETEIKSIQILVSSGLRSEPYPFLKPGARVRIESGAFRGLEGDLVELKGQRRLVLSVSLLQRSVAVELDAYAVTAVE